MKSHDRTQKRSEDESTCPNCGQETTGIATRGPADHTASPCGCPIGAVTARTLNRDDGLRADGSGDGTYAENVKQSEEPEYDPEFVGSHSGADADHCQHATSVDEVEHCGDRATHTQVYKDQNGLHEVASCDECGTPEDVDQRGRSWSTSRGGD